MTDAELTELDLAVARVLGWKAYLEQRGEYRLAITQAPGEREPWMGSRKPDPERYEEVDLETAYKTGFFARGFPKYTRSWSDCGPLVERFDYAHFTNEQADGWVLEADGLTVHADTPQIAICRAIMASGG